LDLIVLAKYWEIGRTNPISGEFRIKKSGRRQATGRQLKRSEVRTLKMKTKLALFLPGRCPQAEACATRKGKLPAVSCQRTA
jgi:hypothetical protein